MEMRDYSEEPMHKSSVLFPEDPQEGLTTQEAAEYLGTSAAVIRRYCRDGAIQFVKVKEPDKAEPIYLIPMGELHKLAFRRRKGQVRTRYVLSTGKVAYGPSLPARPTDATLSDTTTPITTRRP